MLIFTNLHTLFPYVQSFAVFFAHFLFFLCKAHSWHPIFTNLSLKKNICLNEE